MNITFILGSTFNTGGMERMLTTIANATAQLQDENGYTYHVTALSAFNEGRKDFFPFINAVTRVDLGIMLKGGGGIKGPNTRNGLHNGSQQTDRT